MSRFSHRRIKGFASALAVAAVAAAVVIPSSAASAQTLFSRANCSIDGVPLVDEDGSDDSPGNYEVVFAVDWPMTAAVNDVLTTPRVSYQNLIPLSMFDLEGPGTPGGGGVDIGHTLGEFTVIDSSGNETSATIDAVRFTPDYAPNSVTYSEGFLPSQTLGEAGTYTLIWNKLSGTMTNTVDGITESHDWECVPATSPWALATINVSGTPATTEPSNPASTEPGASSPGVSATGSADPTTPRLAETGTSLTLVDGLLGALALTLGAGSLAIVRFRRSSPSHR